MPKVPADDWRRTGQERFLGKRKFWHAKYERWSEAWDHDHCLFCWETFRADNGPWLNEGWATDRDECRGERYYWVCENCFQDFREELEFQITEKPK